MLTVGTYQALHAVYSAEPEEPPTDPEENGIPNNHFENHANGEDANQASQGHIPIPGFLAEANFKICS